MVSRDPGPVGHEWSEGFIRLFISHHHTAAAQLSVVKRHLAPLGVQGFLAHQDIEPDTEYIPVIKSALQTCDALVAVYSKGFKGSEWGNQEVGFAYGRQIPVTSVLAGETPGGLAFPRQALSPGGPLEDEGVCTRLARTIRDRLEKGLGHQATTSALISAFEASCSFEDAATTLRELSYCAEHIDDAQLRRIREAHDGPNRYARGVYSWEQRISEIEGKRSP